jgi:hypothetical protein
MGNAFFYSIFILSILFILSENILPVFSCTFGLDLDRFNNRRRALLHPNHQNPNIRRRHP